MPVTLTPTSSVKYNDNGEYKNLFPSAAQSADVPNAGSVSTNGVISFKHGATELFTIQLPLYDGSVSNGT